MNDPHLDPVDHCSDTRVDKLPEEGVTLMAYYGVPLRELTEDTPAHLLPTSLDVREPAQRAAVFAAGNPADVSVGVGETVHFIAHHWLIYVDMFTDQESGELRPGPVLVLYDEHGKTLKTTSQYGPRRLKAALELYGPDDWAAGIEFIIHDRPSKRPGRHYHDVRIAACERKR